MTAENNEEKYLRATVGAFIENKDGKILLIRSPKWLEGNLWLCPSGGIEYGESPVEACIREAKEETGLDLKDPEFIQVVSMVEPKEFHKPMHFVGVDYKFKLADEKQEIEFDPREVLETKWFEPEEIVKRDDIEFTTKDSVQKMLEMKKAGHVKLSEDKNVAGKHGLFHKHCKDCEKHKQEAVEYKGGWQRAQADYQNLKKEVENMRSEWVRMSEQQILEDFLPVYDNFSKAFKDTEDADYYAENADNADVKKFGNWKKGIEYIMKQYWKVLQDHGVEKIKTVGEMFDTYRHEAVGEEESELPEHTIVKEVESGYMMKDKVIKVAKVIVSK
ncbi:MAG: nucleotide exchange factor GrpE [Candidatus Magasanikiibacteriota bacterium]